MVSIYSKDDLMCREKATRLPSGLEGRDDIETVALSRLSHGDFLLSKRCHRILLSYLNPAPSLPSSGQKVS